MSWCDVKWFLGREDVADPLWILKNGLEQLEHLIADNKIQNNWTEQIKNESTKCSIQDISGFGDLTDLCNIIQISC